MTNAQESHRPDGNGPEEVDQGATGRAPHGDVSGCGEPGAVSHRDRRHLGRSLGGYRWASRRTLQLALGLIWVLDGALQLQPFMFTRGFATQVILPTASGQPEFVSVPVHWAASLILGHPVLWDALFAAVQLVIGLGMLFRMTVRPAIAVSIAWALGVWFVGEGLGGLAGGSSTFAGGAPGAVILYAVIGLAAWPRFGREGRKRVLGRDGSLSTRMRAVVSVSTDEPPAGWVPVAWALVWSLFALLQALPVNSSVAALRSQAAANATGAPMWLAHVQHALARGLGHAGVVSVIAFVVVELIIGGAGLVPGRFRNIAAWTGIVVALAVWVVGQAFGQIPTGMGTDPNSAPLVALLGVSLLGRTAATRVGGNPVRAAQRQYAAQRGLHVA